MVHSGEIQGDTLCIPSIPYPAFIFVRVSGMNRITNFNYEDCLNRELVVVRTVVRQVGMKCFKQKHIHQTQVKR